jgi:hypothetical protein
MTRSNRPLNRILLALVGLLLIAAGGYVIARAIGVDLPAPPTVTAGGDATGLWIAVAIAVVIIVLALAWAFTRGRGRISRLLVLPDVAGSITVDARVPGDLVADALDGNPGVVSVSSSGFRVRGSSVLSLRVTARRGADLASVIRAVDAAVGELDGVLEQRFPVLLQVVSGVRSTMAAAQRPR